MTGILLLDKESGMSSQKAVHKVRSLTGVSKAGHGGTLDPMACGLLPILLGSATKLSDFLLTGDKGYIAGLRFGFVTDTLDVTGQVLRSSDLRPKRSSSRRAASVYGGAASDAADVFGHLPGRAKAL